MTVDIILLMGVAIVTERIMNSAQGNAVLAVQFTVKDVKILCVP